MVATMFGGSKVVPALVRRVARNQQLSGGRDSPLKRVKCGMDAVRRQLDGLERHLTAENKTSLYPLSLNAVVEKLNAHQSVVLSSRRCKGG